MTLTIARTFAFIVFSGLTIVFSAFIFGYHFVLLNKGYNLNLIVLLVGIAYIFVFAPGILKDFLFKSTALEDKKIQVGS